MPVETYCTGCNRLEARTPKAVTTANGQVKIYVECGHCGDVTVLSCHSKTEYDQLQRQKRRYGLIRRARRRGARLGRHA